MNRFRWLLAAVFVLLIVAGGLLLAVRWRGGEPLVDSDQTVHEGGPGLALQPGQPVGQTFLARHAGLTGVELFLLPTNSTPLSLALHLRAEPQSDADLATASLSLPAGAQPGFYRFAFPALSSSHSQYYYAFLDAPELGVSIGLAPGDAYLDGAAYQAHLPLDAQTAFRLVYAPAYVALDLLKAIGSWLGLVAIAGLLFVVPGWALLAWLLPGRRLEWAEMLGLAVGVGLALYPLLLLWTDVVGLHLGPLYAWLPIAGGLVALAWRYRSWRPRHGWQRLQQWVHSEALWPGLILLAVMGLLFGARLLVVRTLDAPMWGDSQQHTMIAQLLVDNGGLFDSWRPYADLDRFTYHFGFHSAIAVLHWVTRLPTIASVLWGGQLLNALAILALYPLALRVTGSRWGGVWAVLLAGLLSPMPMFYVNWGRYTQLAGQAVLPVAVWLTWEAVEMPERRWSQWALAAMVSGGLALTHYRVFIFYGAFALAVMLCRLRRETWRETLLRLVCIGTGAGVFFLPWFIHAFGTSFMAMFWREALTPAVQVRPSMWEYNAVGRMDMYLAPVWWLALLLGLAVGLWRRQREVLLAGVWWFLLLIAANPAWLSLPGTGVITNFALFIAIYLPAGLFSGVLAARLIESAHRRRWVPLLATLLMVSLSAWGAPQRLDDPDPGAHALVTRPDVRAAAWIQANTPADSCFLVNSFLAYGGATVVGSDAGWWLPLLAGRQVTVPPISYSSELEPSSAYRQQVEKLARQLLEQGPDDPELLALLRQQGVTYVYVGQRQGRVNYAGDKIIDPEQLAKSPNYELAYHQDRVWVFKVAR